jgi:hypothetical protein
MLNEEQMNEATAVMRGAWKHTIEGNGDRCPVCDRWGKINATTMSGVMVRSMVWLYHEHVETGQEWVNVPARAPRLVTRSYSISKLKHWGFVVPKEEEQLTKAERDAGQTRRVRKSGLWKLTESGRNFILNNTSAPKHAFIYNDAVVGFDDKLVTARESMKESFDYDMMMQTRYDYGYDEMGDE